MPGSVGAKSDWRSVHEEAFRVSAGSKRQLRRGGRRGEVKTRCVAETCRLLAGVRNRPQFSIANACCGLVLKASLAIPVSSRVAFPEVNESALGWSNKRVYATTVAVHFTVPASGVSQCDHLQIRC